MSQVKMDDYCRSVDGTHLATYYEDKRIMMSSIPDKAQLSVGECTPTLCTKKLRRKRESAAQKTRPLVHAWRSRTPAATTDLMVGSA